MMVAVVIVEAVARCALANLPANNEPVELFNASCFSFPVCHRHDEIFMIMALVQIWLLALCLAVMSSRQTPGH
jgi:hypothetical protein